MNRCLSLRVVFLTLRTHTLAMHVYPGFQSDWSTHMGHSRREIAMEIISPVQYRMLPFCACGGISLVRCQCVFTCLVIIVFDSCLPGSRGPVYPCRRAVSVCAVSKAHL